MVIYQLEQSSSPQFESAFRIYEGPDRGKFVSGLPSGETYYRVRAGVSGTHRFGEWSDVITIHVQYPERRQLVVLISGGVCMLLILLVSVFRGARLTAVKS